MDRKAGDQTRENPFPTRKNATSIGELLSMWPKIVEYTGLSEYEAKVYFCLVGLGSSGARKLSRAREYGPEPCCTPSRSTAARDTRSSR